MCVSLARRPNPLRSAAKEQPPCATTATAGLGHAQSLRSVPPTLLSCLPTFSFQAHQRPCLVATLRLTFLLVLKLCALPQRLWRPRPPRYGRCFSSLPAIPASRTVLRRRTAARSCGGRRCTSLCRKVTSTRCSSCWIAARTRSPKSGCVSSVPLLQRALRHMARPPPPHVTAAVTVLGAACAPAASPWAALPKGSALRRTAIKGCGRAHVVGSNHTAPAMRTVLRRRAQHGAARLHAAVGPVRQGAHLAMNQLDRVAKHNQGTLPCFLLRGCLVSRPSCSV